MTNSLCMKLLQFFNLDNLDTGENGEAAYRGLLLGRQTWDLHDCDCGLMVVAGTCTRAIIVSTTQYFPVVHLLQRRTVPQHSDGILGSLSGNYGSLKLATKEQLGKYSSPVARLIA